MRPSSGVLWAWLGAQHLWTLIWASGVAASVYCLLECSMIGTPLHTYHLLTCKHTHTPSFDPPPSSLSPPRLGITFVGASVCIDRIFYGVWTVVPLNFIRFNAVVCYTLSDRFPPLPIL
jgi:hypothetical protein